MNNIGRLVQRLIHPKTCATAGNAFLCMPRVGCNFTPGTSSGSAFVNSIQKSWFSNLLGRRNEPGQLLALPPPVSSMQVAGFKVKVALKRRCKDCYFVVRQERRFVICATHPRHKQMAPLRRPKYTWIITHATQSKVRPY